MPLLRNAFKRGETFLRTLFSIFVDPVKKSFFFNFFLSNIRTYETTAFFGLNLSSTVATLLSSLSFGNVAAALTVSGKKKFVLGCERDPKSWFSAANEVKSDGGPAFLIIAVIGVAHRDPLQNLQKTVGQNPSQKQKTSQIETQFTPQI
jgi:hypothetical protein